MLYLYLDTHEQTNFTMSQKDNTWLKVSTPRKLHKDFKVACWLENISLTDKMLELMHQVVTENRSQINEAKKVRNL